MRRPTFYKYRAVEPWDYLLDILLYKRLYAASFQTLNDPMEGMFTYSQDQAAPSFIEQMVHHKTKFGICSLSKTHKSTVMWSYYAAAHKGLVLGLKVDKAAESVEAIEDVTYAEDNVFRGFLGSDPRTEARKILCKKLTAWTHEQEVRVFSSGQFIPISLDSVYLGVMMSATHKALLRSLITQLDLEVTIHEAKLEDLDSRINLI
jgi:hypothetical protein